MNFLGNRTGKTSRMQACCFLFLLVAFCLSAIWPGPSFALDEETLCAEVRIEVQQELTLERQAFDAHLRITNGLSHISLENLGVDIWFEDEDGNLALASSDTNDPDAVFFIRVDSMTGIDDTNGEYTVLPSTTADVHWLVIPAPGAANGNPDGSLYYVGATLTYKIAGKDQITRVSPDYIHVKPLPELVLDYFLPLEVYGDDAFTPEIEPPIPFPLGLRVKNNGAGEAKSLRIESSQPRIVDNEQGLAVRFFIEESQVNSEPVEKSLTVDLGNLPSQSASVAQWIMTCSLSGEFTELDCRTSHSDELGGELTSLILAANTHSLVKDVNVDSPGSDFITDFLAKETSAYTLYQSDGTDAPVADLSAQAILQAEGSNGTEFYNSLSMPQQDGFSYVKLADPYDGQKAISSIIRSDGKALGKDNAWLSKSRNEDKDWEYFLNVFDSGSTGYYKLVFDDPASLAQAPVLQAIMDRTHVEGEFLSFVVEASDPNGDTVHLSASGLPAGASFVDQGDPDEDGVYTGVFEWSTVAGQSGTFFLTFTAFDNALFTSQRMSITLLPAWDTDGDGMPDAWEISHFGDLSRDGTGDFDNDGATDLAEYLDATNPEEDDHAPSVPVILSPADREVVALLQPQLSIENSTDPEGDTVTYSFELFADQGFTQMVESVTELTGGTGTTSWSISGPLSGNTWYFWRVRASDGYGISLWAYGSFFVNSDNDPPGDFFPAWPMDSTQVDTSTPSLSVTNARDPDEDDLSYAFEVFEDPGATLLAASVSGLAQEEGGTTSWTVDPGLAQGTYYWRATASDGNGGTRQTPLSSFVVDFSNLAPPEPGAVTPSGGEDIRSFYTSLSAANVADPEGYTVTYYFEMDTKETFDGPDKVVSGPVPQGDGLETAWEVFDLADNTRYFWRVKASDGLSESPWARGEFFVNPFNDAPSAPGIKNPGQDAWVETGLPELQVFASQDPENAPLLYAFEVCSDENLLELVASGETSYTSWTLPYMLSDRTRYYWRARARDGQGETGEWSRTISFFVRSDGAVAPEEIQVSVSGTRSGPFGNINVYAFDASENYLGLSAPTNPSGQAEFSVADFPLGQNLFRADVAGHRFWSEAVTIPGTYAASILIQEETVEVGALYAGNPASGNTLYVYTADGAFVREETLDGNGTFSGDFPAGVGYKFRVDILGYSYWSDVCLVQEGAPNQVVIDAGGGVFSVTAETNTGQPLEGHNVSLFSGEFFSLGLSGLTGADGATHFAVPEGSYQARLDYLGYDFATPVVLVEADRAETIIVEEQEVVITVLGISGQTSQPLAGAEVTLFTQEGQDLGQSAVTDQFGRATFDLPERAYMVRVDYGGQTYWSTSFTWQDQEVHVPMEDLKIKLWIGHPRDVPVWVFTTPGEQQ